MRGVFIWAPITAVLITLAAITARTEVVSARAPEPELGGQQSEPIQPVWVVESFLLARNLGDYSGAAEWCASLLELQDRNEPRYVDAKTTTNWLRQLAGAYVIDVVRQPRADGNSVSWAEQITRRGIPFPEALRSSASINVEAVIRDGKIAFLRGSYPPIEFRSTAATEPPIPQILSSKTAIPPATLFVGSALGMALAALLATCFAAVRGSTQRRWQYQSTRARIRR